MAKPILIVDDSTDDVEILQRFLRSKCVLNPFYHVPDGLLAIDYLYGLEPYSNRQRFPFPKLIFLDIHMPRKTGFEVLEWLNAHPEIPTPKLIIHTHAIHFHELEKCYLLGASAFLHKQTMEEQFRDLVTRYREVWEFTAPLPPAARSLSSPTKSDTPS